jgi:hypothetical protein
VSKESVLLVSFKLKGEDPISTLAQLLAPLDHPDLLEVEVLDDDDFSDLTDDYDFFDNLMGEV